MALKEILLTPGPTHVPPAVIQALSQPTLHHRTDVFKEYFRQASNQLRLLLRTESDPIFISSSGTGAMEAALLNSCNKGDSVIYINAGKFGERWGDIAARLLLNSCEFKVTWGETLNLNELSKFFEKNSSAKCICLQYCETSTAAELPIEQICSIARKILPNAITIVDAISAIGTRPIYPDLQNIDILVGAGHKGLMLPPGLAFIYLNNSAWQRAESIEVQSLYFDLKIERKQSKLSTTAWTPAMNHIVALCASLKMINDEGEENVYKRHQLLSTATKGAILALGLKVFSDASPSNAVTAAVMPDEVDGELVRKVMREKSGVRIAGGQDELKGKLVRFGHMGYVSQSDMIAGFAAFESALISIVSASSRKNLNFGAALNFASNFFREHPLD